MRPVQEIQADLDEATDSTDYRDAYGDSPSAWEILVDELCDELRIAKKRAKHLDTMVQQQLRTSAGDFREAERQILKMLGSLSGKKGCIQIAQFWLDMLEELGHLKRGRQV